jgi:hypothetical protein
MARLDANASGAVRGIVRVTRTRDIADDHAACWRRLRRGAPLFVRDVDGTTAVERPRPNPHGVTVLVDRVSEVDAQGRPVWATGRAVHQYDPIARLREETKS